MMGKTHVAIGILSSLAIFQPTTISQCALAIAGGALGGVAADIDTVDNDYKHDALIGQLLSFGIAGIIIFLMFITTNKSEFYASLSKDKISICIGIIAYLILMIKGYLSNHRTFTHSFLAMLLFTIGYRYSQFKHYTILSNWILFSSLLRLIKQKRCSVIVSNKKRYLL